MMNITEHEELLSIYSDVHKEATGYRPGENQWIAVEAMSLDELKEEMKFLEFVAQDERAREVAAEKSAIMDLRETVASLMSEHGIDQATAYRWLIQAELSSESDSIDVGYFLWSYGCGCGMHARALQTEIEALGVR
jgi:hypothetical protein